MNNAVTEAQIEAYRRAKQIAHGCIYGCYNKYENRHYIVDRSHEVWSMCSDDYEAGHAAMMAEVDRLRDLAALSAALSVQAEPMASLKTENAAKVKAVLDWADALPDAWLIRDPTGQIDTTATTRQPLPSETLEILNLYLHPPALAEHMDDLTRKPLESEADYIARLLKAAGAKADRNDAHPPAPVKPLEFLDPADDEAIDWITSNLMAIRRDNGSMEYGLTAVVRAFQAGAARARAPAVKVLEWNSPPGFDSTWFAKSVIGEYSAWQAYYRPPGSRAGIMAGITIEDAKAAAQAHFDAAIRSALVGGDT